MMNAAPAVLPVKHHPKFSVRRAAWDGLAAALQETADSQEQILHMFQEVVGGETEYVVVSVGMVELPQVNLGDSNSNLILPATAMRVENDCGYPYTIGWGAEGKGLIYVSCANQD